MSVDDDHSDDELIAAHSLQQLRSALFRQEETIIFCLIERAQFCLNAKIYEAGALPTPAAGASFLDFFFAETEKLHSLVRRYTAPEEHAFYPHVLQAPVLPQLSAMPLRTRPNAININDRLMRTYLAEMLPLIARPGDDSQYGSSATADIAALQALSLRVHYGKQVAEAKFQADRHRYAPHIAAGDAAALMRLLTDEAVERQVLERVHLKASTYGQGLAYMRAASGDASSQSPNSDDAGGKLIDADKIVAIYRDFVIPLTKDVQVQYLLQRLGGVPVGYLGPPSTFTHQAALAAFAGRRAAPLPLASIGAVFAGVQACTSIYGVVPYMNSGTGVVAATQAELTACAYAEPDATVQIVDEVYLPVEQTLLVNEPGRGGPLSALRRLYSHPQAISQCRQFIARHLPHVEVVESASTAAAAALCAAQEQPCAAVASELSASVYGLHILERSVQDSPRGANVTRFFVIAKRQPCPPPTGRDTSMLLLGVADQPGALCRVLGLFAAAGVNIKSLEAFKNPKIMWEMNFCLEFHGHVANPVEAAILSQLPEHTSFAVPLGSWPRRD